MAWREWRSSSGGSPTLKKSLNDIDRTTANITIGLIDIKGTLRNFVVELDKSNRESHKIAAISYFLAGLAALASFIISLL